RAVCCGHPAAWAVCPEPSHRRRASMAVTTLREELRAAVESRHSRHHPYYQLWREGKLPREAIAGWVQEHYHYTKDVMWLIGPLLTETPYADVRELFGRNVAEEM